MYLTQVNPVLIQPFAGNLVNIIENDLQNPEKYKITGDLFNNVSNYLAALKRQWFNYSLLFNFR